MDRLTHLLARTLRILRITRIADGGATTTLQADAAAASTLSPSPMQTTQLPSATSTAAPHSSATAAVADPSAVCRLAHLLPRTLCKLRFSHIHPTAKSCVNESGNVSVRVPVLFPATLLLPAQLEELAIHSFNDRSSDWYTRHSHSFAHMHARIPILLQPLPLSMRTLYLGDIDLSMRQVPSLPRTLQRIYLPLTRTHSTPSRHAADDSAHAATAMTAARAWVNAAVNNSVLPACCVVSDSQKEKLTAFF